MALFRIRCTECGLASGRIRTKAEEAIREPCTRCRGPVEREAVGPSAQKQERLDNGFMPRAVTRPAEAERLYEERARNADRLAGGVQHDRGG